MELLGSFRVSVGSRVVEESEWRLRKAASLVKLLALEPRHQIHRERATYLLWPNLGARAAANNLHHTLHIARRVLGTTRAGGSRYLRLRGDLLALYPEGRVWVDAEAFEDAARAARRARDPAAYRVALDLYTGDLLPGELYEEWALDRREGLRLLRLSLLVEMAELYEQRGEWVPAIEALGRVVEIEPTHEETHAGLMRLYAANGQRRAALHQYTLLEETLREAGSPGPCAEVKRLHEEILSEHFSRRGLPNATPPREPAGSVGNLPLARTSFVGREREILDIKRQLAMTRLLTLLGTGGSGKTRLALEVAQDLLCTYSDGIWLVELASLSEPESVQAAVATTLKVREQPGRSITDTLADALRHKEVLLVLDNCEHLVDATAHLADALLGSCPRLRILATSREPLGVGDETRWPLPSLSVPSPGRTSNVDPARYESVRLFVERACQKLPSFTLTPHNAEAVAEVCRRLDGLPLAIELATARVGSLAVEQVAERLEDSLGLLSAGPRTAAPRQRTLRATLQWSHELLSGPEKKLFRRLSAFAGGFTLQAAEATCPGVVVGAGEVLDLLSGLVDKSMVVAEASADGLTRYRLLEPVRQYAREKLEESGETDAVRHRHANFFLALAENAEPQLRGAEQEAWLGRLEVEHDNLRAALSWMLDTGESESALRLTGALGEFWHIRGYLSEGRRWLKEALELESTPEGPRVKALARAGYLAWEGSDYEQATTLGEEALMLSRELGDTAGAADALYNIGAVATLEERFEEASASFREAVALLRTLGDEVGLARALQGLGLVEVARHDFRRAVTLYEEGLPLTRKTGDGLGVALMLGMGALAFLGLGDHRRVRELCAEAMELSERLRHPHAVAFVLHVLASLAGAQGQPVRAARVWGAAEALREAIGVKALSPVEHRHYGPYIAAARDQLEEEVWRAAWAEGRVMTPEQAAAYELRAKEPALPPLQSARIKALAKAGWIAWEQGEFERSTALAREGLALSRSLGDTAGAAASLYNMGIAAVFQEEHARAKTLFKEAAGLQRERVDKTGLGRALQGLGMAVMGLGDIGHAEALYEKSLALARESDDITGIETSLQGLALNALARDDFERVRKICAEVLQSSAQLNYKASISGGLNLMASVAGSEGRAVRAGRLWGASEALRETIGKPDLSPIEKTTFARHIAAARSRLEEEAWRAAWAEGRAMTPEQAVEYALSEEKSSSPTIPAEKPLPAARPLTRREREVVSLIARGLPNRRISATLSISLSTVENHVRNILKKLGLRSREEVATWAQERRHETYQSR